MRRAAWAAAALFTLITPRMQPQAPIQPQPPAPQSPAEQRASKTTAQAPAQALKITFGDQSAAWTAETLAPLPHIAITVYNEHAKASQTYSGVPLIDLLARLGVPDKPRGKQFRLYLVAEGSDGYAVVYSLGEVTPDVHDGTVLVADSEGGKALTESGPFQLVATGEKRPARWVRHLVAIRVLTTE